jgi:hypothetical protein
VRGHRVRPLDVPLAGNPRRELVLTWAELADGRLPEGTVILMQDWFTALFDGQAVAAAVEGLRERRRSTLATWATSQRWRES